MYILVFVEVLLSLCFVAFLVNEYSLRSIYPIIKSLVFITWLLSFGIVFLLPLDIFNTVTAEQGSDQDYSTTVNVWKAIYWANFLLTWLFLPIAQEYELAGQFHWKDKLKRSIINNLIIYGVFGAIGGVFLIYLLFKGNVEFKELTAVLVAASNVFGMLLVVILLSHGIVEIPRKLWREKKYEEKIQENQFMVSKLAKEKVALLQELELVVKELLHYKQQNGASADTETVLALIPQNLLKSWSKSIPKFKDSNIVNLHKEAKRMVLDLNRLESKWDTLLLDTFRVEDIVKDMDSINNVIESTLFVKYKYEWLNKLVWLWYCRIRLIVYPALCVLLAIFAGVVVLSEVSVFSQWFDFLNLFSRIKNVQSFVTMDILMLVPLFYISFCVYYGLFKMKLAGFYGLYTNHQTDAPSLIFSALNTSRVATPLCYNFLQLVDVSDSAFSEVMGTVDLAPVFGNTFNIIFPMLLLLLIAFNAFDMYRKIIKAVGFKKLQLREAITKDAIADGRKRLQKARSQLEYKILNSRAKNLAEYRSYGEEGVEIGDAPSSIITSSSDRSLQSEVATKGPVAKNYYNSFQNKRELKALLQM